MELRERITAATKQAMKDKDSKRLSTLRLISAAVKDRDIAARAEGNDDGVDDAELLSILAKMVKQRRESARTYEEGGRLDLAEAELAEIPVIEEFLPKPMSEDEISKAVNAAVKEVGASSIRDMGRVMGVLKARYQGRMDFGAVGPMVKDRLAAAG
ncbi:GatB/YqeY domain-containing protein [Salipiger sp. H15]|uniref:GatB/YqeY domain-containing protein n=1 Tax=Alloyangia sp. H15 TaxID=3029062 RepID=A0AAU8AKQ4_9RHOB